MCKYDIEVYKVSYDIMITLYCYYYLNIQHFMLCKFVFSRKKYHTNTAFVSLAFMYNSNMSSKCLGPLNVLLQRSHLETMSGANECDKLEKIRNYFSISNV